MGRTEGHPQLIEAKVGDGIEFIDQCGIELKLVTLREVWPIGDSLLLQTENWVDGKSEPHRPRTVSIALGMSLETFLFVHSHSWCRFALLLDFTLRRECDNIRAMLLKNPTEPMDRHIAQLLSEPFAGQHIDA